MSVGSIQRSLGRSPTYPCRLYDGMKLGADIDQFARWTLDTIWGHFPRRRFRHYSAWNCYGPYLTLQLAHAFLLLGDVNRMDQCLRWVVSNAAFPSVPRAGADRWQVALGAWNEQHCYPVSKDFREFPERPWYMGAMPHGWACAEFMTLLRDILFFECDEDGDAQVCVAPGVMPHWLGDGDTVGVRDGATVFGTPFGYRLTHDATARRLDLAITQPPPPHVRLVLPCRFGTGVQWATANGVPAAATGRDVRLPRGTTSGHDLVQRVVKTGVPRGGRGRSHYGSDFHPAAASPFDPQAKRKPSSQCNTRRGRSCGSSGRLSD